MPKSPLKSVVVYLEFDQQLQNLTGVARLPVEVTEGTPFFMLFQAILDSYPAIVTHHDLSSLGFAVNGSRPNAHAILGAHDVISLGLHGEFRDAFDLNDEYYH